MESLTVMYNIPKDKQTLLFTHIRLAHGFSNHKKRLQAVQARLHAISILGECSIRDPGQWIRAPVYFHQRVSGSNATRVLRWVLFGIFCSVLQRPPGVSQQYTLQRADRRAGGCSPDHRQTAGGEKQLFSNCRMITVLSPKESSVNVLNLHVRSHLNRMTWK